MKAFLNFVIGTIWTFAFGIVFFAERLNVHPEYGLTGGEWFAIGLILVGGMTLTCFAMFGGYVRDQQDAAKTHYLDSLGGPRPGAPPYPRPDKVVPLHPHGNPDGKPPRHPAA